MVCDNMEDNIDIPAKCSKALQDGMDGLIRYDYTNGALIQETNGTWLKIERANKTRNIRSVYIEFVPTSNKIFGYTQDDWKKTICNWKNCQTLFVFL